MLGWSQSSKVCGLGELKSLNKYRKTSGYISLGSSSAGNRNEDSQILGRFVYASLSLAAYLFRFIMQLPWRERHGRDEWKIFASWRNISSLTRWRIQSLPSDDIHATWLSTCLQGLSRGSLSLIPCVNPLQPLGEHAVSTSYWQAGSGSWEV